MTKIIDTAENTTAKLAALKAAGIETIIRYLTTSSGSSKLVREGEARAIANMGLKLGLVFENWGGVNNFAHDDINSATGTNHGAFVRTYAPSVGAPEGALVWFAIDTDVQPKQFEAFVVPYFKAIRDVIGKFRVGVYGSGYVCGTLLDRKLVEGAWLAQSKGWLGFASFRDSGRWRLIQGPETVLQGLDVDTDAPSLQPALADYGQFAPFDSSSAAPPGPPGGQPSPGASAPPSTSPAPGRVPAGFRVTPTDARQAELVLAAASSSPVLRHTFMRLGNRNVPIGRPPIGYVKGMGLAYVRCRSALADGNAVVTQMAAPVTDDDSRDFLSWYRSRFAAVGLTDETGGKGTLLTLFTGMLGLGMNESEGKFCCGRDVTARIPPSSNSVETGMFQMSWDAHDLCPELVPLFRSYQQAGDDPEGLGSVFHEGVSCSRDDLENVGSGDGKEFQRMSKASPMFAVLCAGVALRFIGGQPPRGHWGPIRRREVEIAEASATFFRSIDKILDETNAGA